ncbi:MAG: hypothetical protein VB054_03215 [Petrimonas sp.]|nr:hypothetical protein [Petrimonas sp.]
MKKVFLFLLLSVLGLSIFAQETNEFKNVVGISPFQFVNGVRIKYERVLTPKFTTGGLLTGYYGAYPGVQLAPIARFYFKGNAPEGFYAQAKIVGGVYQSTFKEGSELEEGKKSFTSFGAGIAA